jgi:hypothetical protein
MPFSPDADSIVTMTAPRPEFEKGVPDSAPLDRSAQAARFLDLTRRHGALGGDHADLFAALAAADLDGDGVPDVLAANQEIREAVSGDAAVGHAPQGAPIPLPYALDDDGDVFGDGNGFGQGPVFGAENPFE